MARSQPNGGAEATHYEANSEQAPSELPRLVDLTTVCTGCGSHRVVSRPAADLQPGRRLRCLDCGHGGRVKTNRYGGVTMLSGFRIMSGELE